MSYLSPSEVLVRAFPGIPEAEAAELITSGEVHSYPPNTILCAEDAFEATFYILLEGEVRVSKVIDLEQVRILKRLQAGDFFGEMALIHNAPRAATVTTTAPTTVLEIRKEAFDRLLRRSASMSLSMVREVSRRLRENDAMAIEDLRLKASELAAAYQRLAEQDYARREFLTTIAHELRTPLTAASGYLQIIQKGQLKGEALNTGLESVARSVQQIVSLVNDILFLQEMDLIYDRFLPVQLEALLCQVVESFQDRARASNLQLVLQVDPNLPPIAGDAAGLERAFSAVLDNAIKFSPDGGNVELDVRHTGPMVTLVFRDHGVGIPPEALPHVFDRFFHIDQISGHLFRGVGLGLSIARQVIEQHGGNIEVASQVGKGSQITIQVKAIE